MLQFHRLIFLDKLVRARGPHTANVNVWKSELTDAESDSDKADAIDFDMSFMQDCKLNNFAFHM